MSRSGTKDLAGWPRENCIHLRGPPAPIPSNTYYRRDQAPTTSRVARPRMRGLRAEPHAALPPSSHTVRAISSALVGHAALRISSAYHVAYSMFTARETINPIVTSDTVACTPITIFAILLSGIVSVGENAVALVSDTYR